MVSHKGGIIMQIQKIQPPNNFSEAMEQMALINNLNSLVQDFVKLRAGLVLEEGPKDLTERIRYETLSGLTSILEQIEILGDNLFTWLDLAEIKFTKKE
jgi:hypothetical protein